MRDKNKDKKYFNDLITNREKSLVNFKIKIIQNSIKTERIINVKKFMLNNYLTIIKSKYSRGDNLFDEKVIDYYEEALKMMICSWENKLDVMKYSKNRKIIYLKQYTFSGFLDMLNMLSLGVLLNVKTKNFEQLAEIIDKDKVKDFLFEFLISYRVKARKPIEAESYTVFFHINKRYGELKSIIMEKNKETIEKKIKIFLEKKWYQSFKGTPFYDRHKMINNHSYSGYWCFVVAAIVKIMDLDDSTFRDNEYYPKDLI